MASGGDWKLYIKDLIGGTTAVTVNNPKVDTIEVLFFLFYKIDQSQNSLLFNTIYHSSTLLVAQVSFTQDY